MWSDLKATTGSFALSLAVAALTVGAAQAEPPADAEGAFLVDTMHLVSARPAGEVCLVEVEAVFELNGTFQGFLIGEFSIIHFGPCDQPAPELFLADGTFEGDVDGATGSFGFTFVGAIDEDGLAEGELVIGRGTEELSTLSGKITLSGLTGVGGFYDGRVHFAP